MTNTLINIAKSCLVHRQQGWLGPLVLLVFLWLTDSMLRDHLVIMDEQIRQYFWAIDLKQDSESPLAIAILDLYTSESYNASPEGYKARYQLYNLPESLHLACGLGVKRVAFDFFLDQRTWIGKHLLSSSEDSTRLRQALLCFEQVLLPVRAEDNQLLPPVARLSELTNLRYVHTSTWNSLLYLPEKSYATSKGWLSIPYIAQALSGVSAKENDWTPLLPAYLPTVFDRWRFEDLNTFQTLVRNAGIDAVGTIYPEYFRKSTGKKAVIPDILLLGFGHDTLDMHDVATNIPGPISLSPLVDQNQPTMPGTEPTYARYGTEPKVTLTPGLYLVASTAAYLAQNGMPVRIRMNSPWIFVGLLMGGLILFNLCRKTPSPITCLAIFSTGFTMFLAIGLLLQKLAGLYIPLMLPAMYFLLLYLMSDYKRYQGLLKKLWFLSEKPEIHVRNPDRPRPLLFHQAQSFRDSQTDSFARLMASIDLLSYRIQYLALVLMAEHFENGGSAQPIQRRHWLNWSRPTLGTYLYGLKALASQNEPKYLNGLKDTRFTKLCLNLQNDSKQDKGLAWSLHQVVKLRNEWKHFASSNHSEASLNEAQQRADTIEQALENFDADLSEFILIKAERIVARQNLHATWQCLVLTGCHTYLDEFSVTQSLNPGELYLLSAKKLPHEKTVLSLHPWITAGECKYHHRHEIFFFSGLVFDFEQQKPTRQVKYAGLMESCQPTIPFEINSRIAKRLIGDNSGRRGRRHE